MGSGQTHGKQRVKSPIFQKWAFIFTLHFQAAAVQVELVAGAWQHDELGRRRCRADALRIAAAVGLKGVVTAVQRRLTITSGAR